MAFLRPIELFTAERCSDCIRFCVFGARLNCRSQSAKEIKEMIRFIEVDGVLSLVSLGPVDKSAMESYLCKRADVRGTQRQFSENICSEDVLTSRIFGTFVVKFLACLPLLRFSNI